MTVWSGRRIGVLVSALLLCAGLAFAATAAPAVAKKKHRANPLKGSWAGTDMEGHSVSFRITGKGFVLDFSGVANLTFCNPAGCGPFGSTTGPCPTPGLTAAVSAPAPISLSKVVPGYPKGKLFHYDGPGGDPLGYKVHILGKALTPTRLIGTVGAFAVPTPTGQCSGISKGYTASKVG
jgi:hypothetical protein